MKDLESLENYECIRISECNPALIRQFWIDPEKDADGLVYYFRAPDGAIFDESNGTARTYVILDRKLDCIMGYFTVKAGQCYLNEGGWLRKSYKVLPGVELAMLAVNDRYRELYDGPSFSFGEWIFEAFVLPKIKEASQLIGVKVIYIFALPYKPNLIEFYKKLGFINPNYTTGAKRRIRTTLPAFDRGCVFMFQIL